MQVFQKRMVYVGLLFCALSVLWAEDTLTKEAEAYLEKTRKLQGDTTENVASGKSVEDKKGGYFDNYMDTVIWNDTHKRLTDNIPQRQITAAGKEAIVLDTPVENLKAQWDAQEAKLAALRAGESNTSKEAPIIFAGGFCTLEDTLSISKYNEYGKLDCMLDFGEGQYKRSEVFASFYPDYKREMVIAIPMYMSFEDGSRASFSGIVMKADKTSINLAGWSDSMRIAKMVGEGLLMVNDIVYRYASDYMSALMQSRIREEYVYPPEGNYTNNRQYNGYFGYYDRGQRITNVAPPEARDYIITAGMQILTNIFAITGKDYMYAKTPLFAVYPQKVYVEGMVSFDRQGLAQRFGQISQHESTKATGNNTAWKSERDQIINRYGGVKTGSAIKINTTRSRR